MMSGRDKFKMQLPVPISDSLRFEENRAKPISRIYTRLTYSGYITSFFSFTLMLRSVFKLFFLLTLCLMASCTKRGIRNKKSKPQTDEHQPDDSTTAETTQSIDWEENPPEIDLNGILYHNSDGGDSLFFPDARIVCTDEERNRKEVEVDENGRYQVYLYINNLYRVEYSADGYYSKHIILDTYNISDSILGGGIIMPTDMQLGKDENEAIRKLLKRNPIGKAQMMESIQDLGWDFEYTDSIKTVIHQLEMTAS
jgi:hypothetical protein